MNLDLDLAMEDIGLDLEANIADDVSEGDADEKSGSGKNDSKEISSKDDKIAKESMANAALMDLASPEEISDIAESYDEQQSINETFGVAMERSIVRIDRKGRMNHLQKQAELNIARQNNDPLYRKLVKLWAMERVLEKKIQQKYNSQGAKIARVKIKDYAANGRRIAKPNPSTVAFKGTVNNRVAQRAVGAAKKMFSNGQNKLHK